MGMLRSSALLVSLVTLTACPADSEPELVDPIAPIADDPDQLNNVDADLEALLEHGDLVGACDRYFAGEATTRRDMLLCGKEMFFYETFGAPGVPLDLLTFTMSAFPDQIGPGFAAHGMHLDPFSELGLPVGYAPAAPLDDVETANLTCASCHFAQLPDGRYAVGAGNHDFAYGEHNVTIILLPQAVVAGTDDMDPAAAAVVAPLAERVLADEALTAELVDVLSGMLGIADAPPFDAEAQRQYMSWPVGTLDAIITPVPVDDEVYTTTKIRTIWEIPRPDEAEAAGMVHGMLGSMGTSLSVATFLEGFVTFFGAGGTDVWTPERTAPLEEYIYSLRRPMPLDPPDEAAAEAGLAVFHEAGCIDCHQGPRGSGLELFDWDEIGTDDSLMGMLDPDLDGEPCCGADFLPGEGLTYALKSPRLAGAWRMSRWLHNGGVASLESLFCLDGPRTDDTEAIGDVGHDYGCDLPEADRLALIDYLNAR